MPEALQLPQEGASLHYEVQGGSGPWLVFVSGLGGHGIFWYKQAMHFNATHRVVYFDHRGHGQSTGGDSASGIEQGVGDLLLLLNKLGAERVRLVGHSMGGMIAQQFTLDNPERVEMLTISGSGARLDIRARLMMEFRRKVLLEMGREDFCRLQTILSAGDTLLESTEEDVLAKERMILENLPTSSLVSARIKSILNFDKSEELKRISVPTLIISAEDDDTAPPKGGEDLNSLIPNSQLYRVSGGGHFFPRTNPGEYNRILEEFFVEQTK